MSDAPPSLRKRIESVRPTVPVTLPTRILACGALAALAFVQVKVPGALPPSVALPVGAFLLAIITGKTPQAALEAPATPRESPEAKRKV